MPSVAPRHHLFMWLLWSVLSLSLSHAQGEVSPASAADLWALEPLPPRETPSLDGNLIDRILDSRHRDLGLSPAPQADPGILLRRLSFDLIGLPPAPEEMEAFVGDPSPDAYEKQVDRLLASPQHGVRYARLWMDVLRYADVDDRMPAANSIHLWRDWMIRALNRNLPYDAFVRAQISGYESSTREELSATGFRRKLPPRPDSQFALGFLARGATSRSNEDHALATAAAETISSAFLGMTLHCAKCHDHMYDPITQEDYYRMKALFDPLVVREVPLATLEQIIEHGEALRLANEKRAALDREIEVLTKPYHDRLYEERVAMLPLDIQKIIRTPEARRSPEEVKIADDYFPILRIDGGPLTEIMPPEVRQRFQELQDQRNGVRRPRPLPAFLTVEEDSYRLHQPSFILDTGDPARPDPQRPVSPGFLFQPEDMHFREGRRETFVDWLTSRDNALFARVAVNRMWHWHFGRGIHPTPNDFGSLTGTPELRDVLDGLAVEFVAQGFDMKWLHKTMVMSQAYRRSSLPLEAGLARDPANAYFLHYPLRRLDAEAIHDSIVMLAGRLDLSLYGLSYEETGELGEHRRRAAFIKRGFHSQRQELPAFLDTFDAEDGRESCPLREETVTAPQALWLMNNPLAQEATEAFAARLDRLAGPDVSEKIDLGYRMALGRPPTKEEAHITLDYMQSHPAASEKLAWMLFNLDEFIYLP